MTNSEAKQHVVTIQEITKMKELLQLFDVSWSKKLAVKMFGDDSEKSVYSVKNISHSVVRSNTARVKFLECGNELLEELVAESKHAKDALLKALKKYTNNKNDKQEITKDIEAIQRLRSRKLVSPFFEKEVIQKIEKGAKHKYAIIKQST